MVTRFIVLPVLWSGSKEVIRPIDWPLRIRSSDQTLLEKGLVDYDNRYERCDRIIIENPAGLLSAFSVVWRENYGFCFGSVICYRP